jgi:hypothetical protein
MGMAWSLPLVSGKQSLNFGSLVFSTNLMNEQQNIILFVSPHLKFLIKINFKTNSLLIFTR